MNTNQSTQEKTIKFLVNIPVELEKKIREQAKKERRTRNAEIVRALEKRYESEEIQPIPLAA